MSYNGSQIPNRLTPACNNIGETVRLVVCEVTWYQVIRWVIEIKKNSQVPLNLAGFESAQHCIYIKSPLVFLFHNRSEKRNFINP